MIDTARIEPVGSIEVGGRPWGIALSSDGHRLYTANGPANNVAVVDILERTVAKKINVGDRPWGVAVA
jgi:YVTN family beta-propeller protein